MPELPDVVLYVEALDRLLTGQTIREVRVRSPFVLRTFDPMIDEIAGRSVSGFSRRGKRIVWHFGDGPYLVVHPMIAGRFHWKKPGYAARGKNDLLALDFDIGAMVLTEASKKKRAGVWLLRTIAEVDAVDLGGLDVLNCTIDAFKDRLCSGRNMLKRALLPWVPNRRADSLRSIFGKVAKR